VTIDNLADEVWPMNEKQEWGVDPQHHRPLETAAGPAPENGSAGWADRTREQGTSSDRITAGDVSEKGNAVAPGIDPWSLVEMLVKRWPWLLGAGILLAAAGLFGALSVCKTTYTAPVELIRFESPNVEEVFRPRQDSGPPVVNLLRSPELLCRVCNQARPGISPETLSGSLQLMPDRNNEVLIVAVSGTNPQATVDLANLYAREAVRFTEELQGHAAGEVNQFLKNQLAKIDADIEALHQKLRSFTPVPDEARTSRTLSPAASALLAKYRSSRDELLDLLTRFTDEYPAVQAQRDKLAVIEKQLRASGVEPGDDASLLESDRRNQSMPASARSLAQDRDLEVLRGQLVSLENGRATLAVRQHAAQSFEDHPAGYFRFVNPVALKDVLKHGRRMKVASVTVFGGFMGMLGTAFAIVILGLLDPRLKTASDVRRVTRLPILASLGDLRRMDARARQDWAFRTWTALQSRLSPSPNHGLVCGITSSSPGEGRSTWIQMLAEAARQRGFRVLTIATRPTSIDGASADQIDSIGLLEKKEEAESAALTANVFLSPATVAEKLIGLNGQSLVHIPLPGWVWNLERRKQWQAALEHWRGIDNSVILVELPPASVSEAVLLAENLPNLIWLVRSGQANAAATRTQLETLRHARCRLAGAVLNDAPAFSLSNRVSVWTGSMVLMLGMVFASGRAQEISSNSTPPPAGQEATAHRENVETIASFSVTASTRRAPWQERLALGPGDTLTISLFGKPELTRTELFVGPDGRVSYLEAQDILASGLTIDELRAKLDEALAKYRRAPRTIVTPVVFRSKKYFVLGRVSQRGAFTLDRPTTIIEAVAQARGWETGLSERNAVEGIDFSKSFLIRHSQRVRVDFVGLFKEGDLTQNIALEPDDYLYFAPHQPAEVYILGEVKLPGPLALTSQTTALGAIAERGGFSDRAWAQKVLVVRGSLNRPETFVLNAAAVLSARATDLKLESRDIVYVGSRPWIKAEELLDMAISAFAQGAVVIWTGGNIGPLIK
jgi:protein involved in polysaccharide export with SLBB domain/capsular polysaccharide biosynthesis protein